jgi:hypothetical protein
MTVLPEASNSPFPPYTAQITSRFVEGGRIVGTRVDAILRGSVGEG